MCFLRSLPIKHLDASISFFGKKLQASGKLLRWMVYYKSNIYSALHQSNLATALAA
jgi:hypothetical protein